MGLGVVAAVAALAAGLAVVTLAGRGRQRRLFETLSTTWKKRVRSMGLVK